MVAGSGGSLQEVVGFWVVSPVLEGKRWDGSPSNSLLVLLLG